MECIVEATIDTSGVLLTHKESGGKEMDTRFRSKANFKTVK